LGKLLIFNLGGGQFNFFFFSPKTGVQFLGGGRGKKFWEKIPPKKNPPPLGAQKQKKKKTIPPLSGGEPIFKGNF